MGIVTIEMSAETLQAILDAPAMEPPSGVTPNFIDPPNLQHRVTLTLALCITLSTLTVMLRICTKFFIVRQTTIDDCMFFCPVLSKYLDTDAL